MATKQRLMSTREAAEMLGCTPSGVRYHVNAGRLDVHHKGTGDRGAMLFKQSDVERLDKALKADA